MKKVVLIISLILILTSSFVIAQLSPSGKTDVVINVNGLDDGDGEGDSPGGGGGRPRRETSCQPTWDCTDWTDSERLSGIRNCTDINSCNNNTRRPGEFLNCPIGGNPVPPIEAYCGDGECNGDETGDTCIADCPIDPESTSNRNILILGLIIIILLILLVILMPILRRMYLKYKIRSAESK